MAQASACAFFHIVAGVFFMMKQIQKMLSLMSLKFAPFSAKELNGNKTGYLYSRKGKIECQFDFYYIEHGIVYSINYLYFNDRHHRDSLKRIVSITNLKEMSSPKEYFVLTRHFKLHPDYDTYRDVVKAWIENNDLLFYEDINVDDLPNSLSDDFTKISEDITAETYSILEGAEPVAEGSLYADLFVINGKTCVVTGMGKTDACKPIADKDLAYDLVMYRKGNRGIECKWCADEQYLKVDYWIHMDSINFEEIIEVNLYEFIQRAWTYIDSSRKCIPSIYQLLKRSDCKLIVVPFTSTHEKKIEMLKMYFNLMR